MPGGEPATSPTLRFLAHRVTFVLGVVCLGMLAFGLIVELVWGVLLFEDYLSTFFAYTLIFAVLSEVLRPPATFRSGSPTCSACGYNLTGNTSGRCPECGREIEQKAEDQSRVATPPQDMSIPAFQSSRRRLCSQ